MVDLEKRISGDWFELKEKAGDLYSLLDVLGLSPAEMRSAADRLKLSVEQGIIEFKRTVLSPVLVALETARYKSLAGDDMLEQEKSLTVLLFVVLVQRLLATDVLPRARPAGAQKSGVRIDDLEVSTILEAVKSRIKGNPDLRAHPAIKNILVQIQVYNKENKKMRELLPGIRPEMRGSFLTNFARTFDGIVASVRRHYATLVEEETAVMKSRTVDFSMATAPLKDLGPLLLNQAREIARIRSTLAHARDEKYKTREVLVRLYDSRHEMLRQIEDELKSYRRVCKVALQYDLDGCAQEIAVGFRDQIVGILEKQGRREEPG